MLTDYEKPKKARKTRKGVPYVNRITLTPAEKEQALDDALLFFYRIGASAAAGFLDKLREARLERLASEAEEFKKQ